MTDNAPMLSQGNKRTGDEPMLGGDKKMPSLEELANAIMGAIERCSNGNLATARTAHEVFLDRYLLELDTNVWTVEDK